MTTTPNEFLQFAEEMGLGQIKSPMDNNNNGYTQTGLSVLNNLCHLIEQIHTLKAENDRLRAHLGLMKHVEKFLSKTPNTINEEEKSMTLSPSNSLKVKKYGSPTLSISSRERQGTDFVNNQEDSSSMIHTESDMMDSYAGLSTVPSWNNWSKVRNALKFSRRRKPELPANSILTIPAISISVESGEDEYLQESKYQKTKKKLSTTNDYRHEATGEDSDHEDELIELTRMYQKRERYRNNRANSSGNDTNNPMPTDEEQLLRRKQSKIANYRRKLRSKLNTVKRQFSDQTSSSTSRLFYPAHTSILDDFGSGVNHALLTVQLAPAMTKSYQQKMREWQIMQKSNFLVNYRRQSIISRTESNNESRKTSIIIPTINETQVLSADESISEMKTDDLPLSPILSPPQRSFIVHQWREIMSEEISLRIYSEYLEKKMQELKQLQTDLKSLKTSIFSTNNQDYFLKHRSMTSIDQLDQDVLDQHRQTSLPQRCRSFQSFISMPASWILAVQSAAYSDILDGTSKKTTDRAIILNKNFFQQLNHFKNDRYNFEQNTFKHLRISTNSMPNILDERNSNERRSIRTRTRTVLTRGHLRKLSLVSPIEIPSFYPMTPSQKFTSTLEISSHIDQLIPSDTELNLPSSSLNKRSKRSRFDLKKTLQRSKSMCMSQFHSWFQRRRQQQPFVPRRKSATEPKAKTEFPLSSSTSKLVSSPRLARLHRRIFKQNPSSAPASPMTELPPILSSSQIDDSDEYFNKQEPPVRIYLPAQTSPTTRHVRIADNEIKTPSLSKITSPIINRPNFPSSMKTATARERRESYAALSNILNN